MLSVLLRNDIFYSSTHLEPEKKCWHDTTMACGTTPPWKRFTFGGLTSTITTFTSKPIFTTKIPHSKSLAALRESLNYRLPWNVASPATARATTKYIHQILTLQKQVAMA